MLDKGYKKNSGGSSKGFSGSSSFKSDPLVTKMINLLMRHGKRSKAERVLSRAIQALDKEYPGQALHIFYLAVIAVKQDVAVRLRPKPKKKRRDKDSYNVYLPRLISPEQGLSLGIRSILKESRVRSQASLSPLWESLAQELVEAAQNQGRVVTERYKVNDLARSNKRRLHFGIRR